MSFEMKRSTKIIETQIIQHSEITHGHVGPRAHEGIGQRINEFPTDTKVAEFDFSSGVDQNV